jgi:hypothetical protein
LGGTLRPFGASPSSVCSAIAPGSVSESRTLIGSVPAKLPRSISSFAVSFPASFLAVTITRARGSFPGLPHSQWQLTHGPEHWPVSPASQSSVCSRVPLPQVMASHASPAPSGSASA